MAAVRMSHQSVHRIWKNNDLKSHLLRTFNISSDPHFEPKFLDIIELYLNPPAKALVLCGCQNEIKSFPAQPYLKPQELCSQR